MIGSKEIARYPRSFPIIISAQLTLSTTNIFHEESTDLSVIYDRSIPINHFNEIPMKIIFHILIPRPRLEMHGIFHLYKNKKVEKKAK